jgi:hypothetical protein
MPQGQTSTAGIAWTRKVRDVCGGMCQVCVDTRGGREDRLKSASHPGRALTVRQVRALSDLDNITVRIAYVAANLAVFGYRFRDKLGSSTSP